MAFVRHDLFRLVDELDRFGPDYSPIALGEIERSLVFRFLLAQTQFYRPLAAPTVERKSYHVVDTVEAFIEANWDKPIDVEQLAQLAGTSVRTMFRQFALADRDSPGQFAKRIRLHKAAELLRIPDEKTTVTGVAFRCGFQRFRVALPPSTLNSIGELPSETLKRSVYR